MLILRVWSGIRDHWPGRRPEWTLGAGALAMGLALTIQPYMFDLARHYATLDAWAAEWVFADLFLACGAFRLIALTINGTFDGFAYSPHLRVFGAIMGAFLWGAFSYSFLTAYATTAGLGSLGEASLGPAVVYGILAAVEMTNVRTASMDVGALSKGGA